jgi:hypothetical protein
MKDCNKTQKKTFSQICNCSWKMEDKIYLIKLKIKPLNIGWDNVPQTKFSWYWAKTLNFKYSIEKKDKENGLCYYVERRCCTLQKENKIKKERDDVENLHTNIIRKRNWNWKCEFMVSVQI